MKPAAKKEAPLPLEAVAIEKLLAAQGAQAWDRAVVGMLLEFSYRHVGETLEEARHYAAHRTGGAAETTITLADVQLAAHNRLAHSFTEPLGGPDLEALVKPLNAQPLPGVPVAACWGALPVGGLASLLQPTFQVLPPSAVRPPPEEKDWGEALQREARAEVQAEAKEQSLGLHLHSASGPRRHFTELAGGGDEMDEA
jgi:histone H3/H4